MDVENNVQIFFEGQGEIANIIQNKSWNGHALGQPQYWDKTLLTNINILLNSSMPMFIFWGNDFNCFYNDAYKELNAIENSPNKIGLNGEDFWQEKWKDVKLTLSNILLNEQTTFYLKLCFKNFLSYSHLYSEKGVQEGLLIVCNKLNTNFNVKDIEDQNPLIGSILNNSPGCIKIIDTSCNIIYINENGVGLLEADNKEYFLYKNCNAFWEPQYVPLFDHAIQHAIEGIVNNFTACAKTAKGNIKWWEVTVSPIKNNLNKIDYLLMTCRDITEYKIALNEVVQSKNLFQAAIDAVQGVLWTNNSIGEMEGEQPAWAKLTGQQYEEYQGYGWAKAIHVEDAEPTIAAWNKAVAAKSTFNFEHRVNTKQYGWKLFSIRAVPVFNEEGNIEQWVGVHTDISSEREAIQKIKESEERFKALADESPMFVFLIDADPQAPVLYNNKTWLTYTGLNAEEAAGRAWNGIMHPDDMPKALEFYVPALTAKQPYFIPAARVLRHDGEYRWHSFKGNPRYLPNGEFNGYVGVGFDIHEQKIAEEKVRASETRFRALAETIPQLVWETDATGNELFTSFRWKEFTDYTISSIDAWHKIVHKDDYQNMINKWAYSMLSGETFKTDVRLQNRQGNYLWHTVAADPVYDLNNKIIKWIGAFTDIHAEKEFADNLKKQVSERTNELAMANDILEIKNIELKTMNKELESFAYISSHDLQEPLRKIQVFTAQIMDKEFERLSDNGKNIFDRIQNASKRMKTLIEDLLTYSKTSISDRKFEVVELKNIVDEVTDNLKEEIANKNASIQLHNSSEISIIRFQFKQLLYNLISNALKFCTPNTAPVISINVDKIEGKLLQKQFDAKYVEYDHIILTDNGIGFEQKYCNKIFEVFQRLHGKTEFSGTGIGLAIVKKIVDNHDGFIVAESELEKGATFNIYIPCNRSLNS